MASGAEQYVSKDILEHVVHPNFWLSVDYSVLETWDLSLRDHTFGPIPWDFVATNTGHLSIDNPFISYVDL